MKTVGDILKNQRTKLNLSLEEVSKKTKIQEKYLKSIENSDYQNLPTATFVKGFIQNYASSIGIDSKKALAIFRRDFAQDPKGKIIPRSLISPIEKKLYLSPKTLSTVMIAAMSLLIIGFFARQAIIFYQGPEIIIEHPKEDQQVISPLEIKGRVKNTTEIIINNQEISLNQDDTFSTQIQLFPGEHTITVVAKSRDGKTKTLQRHIVISP